MKVKAKNGMKLIPGSFELTPDDAQIQIAATCEGQSM